MAVSAIDELMTPDYRITTAGQVIEGREAFKAWVADMQRLVGDATNEHLEVFTNSSDDRVVSRWITRGVNNGMFACPPTGGRSTLPALRSGAWNRAGSPNAGRSGARTNCIAASPRSDLAPGAQIGLSYTSPYRLVLSLPYSEGRAWKKGRWIPDRGPG